MDDGRHNNNGWLQELPDPITKLTWDNAILMSPKTAQELGVAPASKLDQTQQFYDQVVEIQLGGRTVRGPVWVQPGMADYTLGLALGYGREKTGRVGRDCGYNAYKLRTKDAMHYASNAKLTKTGATYQLSTTQSHWSMEGRAPVREANLEDFRKQPDFARKMRPGKAAVGCAAVSQSVRRGQGSWAAPMGHGDRFEQVRRLLGLHGGLPEREQHPDCGQGNGGQEPRNALDSH